MVTLLCGSSKVEPEEALEKLAVEAKATEQGPPASHGKKAAAMVRHLPTVTFQIFAHNVDNKLINYEIVTMSVSSWLAMQTSFQPCRWTSRWLALIIRTKPRSRSTSEM